MIESTSSPWDDPTIASGAESNSAPSNPSTQIPPAAEAPSALAMAPAASSTVEQRPSKWIGFRRRRRRRTNWLLCALWLGLVGFFALYVFAVPPVAIRVYHWLWPKKLLPSELELKPELLYLLRSCEFLFLFWFFFLGACIGSFLNVVAWRVPRRESIVFGGSKCPFCKSRLSFLDNFPVFGWVTLQGRCRTCKLPIAPRYVLIEIVFGFVFLVLAVVELIGNGSNLPHWILFGQRGIVATVFFPNWTLIGAYAFHCATFSIGMMIAATDLDRTKFPSLQLSLLVIAAALTKLAFPTMSFVGWAEPFSLTGINALGWQGNQIMTLLCGMGMGWVAAKAAIPMAQKLLDWSIPVEPETEPISVPQSIEQSPESPFDECFSKIEADIGSVEPVEELRAVDETSLSVIEHPSNSHGVRNSTLAYHWVFLSILLGTVFGWQAIIWITLFAIVLLSVGMASTILIPTIQTRLSFLRNRSLFAFVSFISAALIHQLLWRQLAYFVGIR